MKQGLLIIDIQNDYFPQGKFTLVNAENYFTIYLNTTAIF